MNARSPFFRASVAALVGLNAIFAFLIWSFFDASTASRTAVPPLPAPAESAPAASSMVPPASPPPAEVEDIASRPLFSRGRVGWTPPPPSVAHTPSPVAAALNAKVIGIVATPEVQTVFIVTPSVPEGTWVEDGEMIEGWKVVRVTPKSATLAKDGALTTFYLFPDER